MRWALIGVLVSAVAGLGGAAIALGDASALTLTTPLNGSTTNIAAPTFSGSASTDLGDSDTVTVNVYSGLDTSGTLVQSPSTTQSGGSWSVGVAPPLADGVYTAQAAQVLSGGPAASTPHTFTVDVTPPASSAAALPAHEAATVFNVGYNATDATSGLAKVELFAKRPGDVGFVKVGEDNTPGATGSIAFTAGQGDGAYRFYTRATDHAGNTEPAPATEDASTVLDTHAPTVTLAEPTDGAVTTDTTPGLSGAAGDATEDSATVTVTIHTGSTTAGGVAQTVTTTRSGSTWSAAAAALPTGTYTAQAAQVDAAGNLGASAAHTFTITTPAAPPPPPANVPPTASFVAVPGSPLTGETVTFVSTSADPDGPIASLAWDLDGDGGFADAAGASARTSFATAGTHRVSLRVTDAGGASAIASQTIKVASPPPPAPQLLSPFPIVRIAGRATRSGVKLRLLAAEAPSGSRVLLSCRGRSCPRARESRVAPGRAGSARLRLVSFPRFARSLRAGVVLEVRVTRSGRIGKYTRFIVRRNRAPQRTDSCLMPGASTPKACPAS